MSAQVFIERILEDPARPDAAEVLRIVWVTGGTAAEREALGRSGEAAAPPAADGFVLGAGSRAAGDPAPGSSDWTARWAAQGLARHEDEALLVEWRPGWARVSSPVDRTGELRTALADFARQEAALRGLEAALPACEAGSAADVARAYGIRFRDRAHWRGWQERIEACTRLRLAFVRLRPGAERATPGLPAAGRRAAARLRRQARVAERLEWFSERLEAMEDLYEGAHDRVSDYRWFLHGQMLEVGIVVLLLAEVVLMALELHARLTGRLPS
jgi:hypothetical protein